MVQENNIDFHYFTGIIDATAGTAIANAGIIATTDFHGQAQRLKLGSFRKHRWGDAQHTRENHNSNQTD